MESKREPKTLFDIGQIRKMDAIWGSGFYDNLSKELKAEFPEMKGFSKTNLKYCKYFYQLYSFDDQIRQQLADEFTDNPLFMIPWRHHIYIIDKCKSVHEALFYFQKTIKNGWSRAMLMNYIDTDLYSDKVRP